MKDLILLLIGSVVMNNCVLQAYLGVTSVLGNAKCPCKCVRLGLSVTLLMVLTMAVAWPLQTYLLQPYGLEYFQTLAFVLVILALAGVLRVAFGKARLFSLPLVVLNTAVLGVTLQNLSLTYVQALVAALGAGLGLMVVMLLFVGVREKLQERYMPKAFRGLPADLMTGAILAMAVMAF